MIKFYSVAKIAVFFALLILSSCTSYKSQVACPSFGSNKTIKSKSYKRGFNLSDVVEVFSFKNKPKSNNSRKKNHLSEKKQGVDLKTTFIDPIISAKDDSLIELVTQESLYEIQEPDDLKMAFSNPIASTLDDSSIAWATQKSVYESVSANTHTYEKQVKKVRKVQKKKNVNRNIKKSNLQNQKIRSAKRSSYKDGNEDVEAKNKRKTAIIKGGSLILMAILALFSIPVLGTLTASIGLVGIFLLDILVSFGLFKYYKTKNPKLAKITGFLRLIYTAIFGIGIGFHIAGNVAMFNTFWQIGLIGFGLHLISLGKLFNNEGGKKWVNIVIKSLLILAGIQYIFLNAGILFFPSLIAFEALKKSIFILPMILGELFFAFWMIFKGGKKRKIQ